MGTTSSMAQDEDAAAGADSSLVRRTWSRVRFPVTIFALVGIVLYAVSYYSHTFMAPWVHYDMTDPYKFRGDQLLGGWMRYDAYWYTDIANHGYSYAPGKASSVAFFPVYPLAMRALSSITTDNVLSGIVLTFFSGMGFAVLFYRWCISRMSTAAARLAVVMLLVYPYAYYLYGAIYGDALFLVLTMGAFVLLERDHPVQAGLLAAVATAARPVGVAVFIGLLAVEADRRQVIVVPYLDRVRSMGWRAARSPGVATNDDGSKRARAVQFAPRRARRADLGILLALGGIAAWCWYLWSTFGDALLFVKVQEASGWNQAQGPSTWFKSYWFELLRHTNAVIHDHVNSWDAIVYTSGVTFQAALALAFLVAVPLVIRRIGWGYAVYVLVVVAIPIEGTKDWQGTGRYLLAGFPVFAAVAVWLSDQRQPWLRRGLVVASGSLLILFTSAFARGYYLS